MSQIEELRLKLEAMQSELAESAAARRRGAVQAELNRQAPNVPDVIRRLAVAELGGTDDVVSEVKQFLSSGSVSGLIEQPVPEKKTNQGKRPKLSEMLGDFQNGNAKFTMGR